MLAYAKDLEVEQTVRSESLNGNRFEEVDDEEPVQPSFVATNSSLINARSLNFEELNVILHSLFGYHEVIDVSNSESIKQAQAEVIAWSKVPANEGNIVLAQPWIDKFEASLSSSSFNQCEMENPISYLESMFGLQETIEEDSEVKSVKFAIRDVKKLEQSESLEQWIRKLESFLENKSDWYSIFFKFDQVGKKQFKLVLNYRTLNDEIYVSHHFLNKFQNLKPTSIVPFESILASKKEEKIVKSLLLLAFKTYKLEDYQNALDDEQVDLVGFNLDIFRKSYKTDSGDSNRDSSPYFLSTFW